MQRAPQPDAQPNPQPAFNCARLAHLLPLHGSGDLSADLRHGVEGHLQECEACRGRLRDFEHQQDLLRHLAQGKTQGGGDPDLWKGLVARLRRERGSS